MLTTTEIAKMRQQGQLSEAYDAIREQLEQHKDDYGVILTAAWIYHDLLKQNAYYSNRQVFDRLLSEFLSLGVREEEYSIYESIAWEIRKMLASVAEADMVDFEWLDSLIATLRTLPVPKTSGGYHSLLQAAIKIRNWPGIIDFINWWGLDHLTEADYRPNTNSQGQHYMGLAETTYYALCRAMMTLDDKERQSSFIDKLQRVIDRHPDYRFLPYYKTKLLLRLGRKDEALNTLRQFAQNNESSFWVWQLLGDEHRDINDKMMFYCKAVTCPAADNMVVKLQEQVGRFFISRNMVEMGKYLIEKAYRTRQKEGSHIPFPIENLRREPWYEALEERWDDEFAAAQVQRAEQFLFGELQHIPVLVTYVNFEKHIVSFVSEELREGYFRLPKNNDTAVERGQVLIIDTPALAENAPTNVRSFTIDNTWSNHAFFRPFAGTLRLNFNGFGFVDDVFVETRLLEGLTNGAPVSGIARKTYNRKKESWGWNAVSIEHD